MCSLFLTYVMWSLINPLFTNIKLCVVSSCIMLWYHTLWPYAVTIYCLKKVLTAANVGIPQMIQLSFQENMYYFYDKIHSNTHRMNIIIKCHILIRHHTPNHQTLVLSVHDDRTTVKYIDQAKANVPVFPIIQLTLMKWCKDCF